MLYDEFPHEVMFQVFDKVDDGAGGYTEEWSTYATIQAFVDTPSSREAYQAHKLGNPLDRYLYYPYRTDIKPNMRVVYENETYELAGKPEDQGGQHEIMRVALKLVK